MATEKHNTEGEAAFEALNAEREIAARWWSILHEMTFRRELPDWARKMGAGSSSDMDAYRRAKEVTDAELSGLRPEFTYAVWTRSGDVLKENISERTVADAAADELRSRYPDATVVRVRSMGGYRIEAV
jgi:hypothetical protein